MTDLQIWLAYLLILLVANIIVGLIESEKPRVTFMKFVHMTFGALMYVLFARIFS